MAIVETGQCYISKLNSQGFGEDESKTVAIPYTAPGDLASFHKHKYRNKSNCALDQIIEPSPHRQAPICKYFERCGGCRLQHLSQSLYTEFKLQQVIDPLDNNNLKTSVLPLIITRSPRRRANLEAIKKDGGTFMGFHKLLSHQIIDLDSCPALLPELSDLLLPIKELLNEILELRQKASIYLTKAENGVDITLGIHKQREISELQKEQIRRFAQEQGILQFTFQARKKREIIYKTQEPYVIFRDHKVAVDSLCFLQASSDTDQILAQFISNELSKLKNPPSKAVDLFCGRGTYTFALASYSDVDAFEHDEAALNALKEARGKEGIISTQLTTYKRDLFEQPLTKQELEAYDFLVLNPPRCGAAAQVQEIAKARVDTMIYVSCNPQSFAEDAAILCQSGYLIEKIQPIDQFVWSHHVELIAVFTKSKKD